MNTFKFSKFRNYMGKYFNQVRNTLWVVPRTIWTLIRWVVDTTKTALNAVLDFWKWLGKTCSDIKQAVHDSLTNGKRYRKLWKIPVTLACLLPMLWEWTVETLWWTGANAVVNTVDTVWNVLINEWNAVKLIWKVDDPKTYVLSKTDFRDISPKNLLANAFIDK